MRRTHTEPGQDRTTATRRHRDRDEDWGRRGAAAARWRDASCRVLGPSIAHEQRERSAGAWDDGGTGEKKADTWSAVRGEVGAPPPPPPQTATAARAMRGALRAAYERDSTWRRDTAASTAAWSASAAASCRADARGPQARCAWGEGGHERRGERKARNRRAEQSTAREVGGIWRGEGETRKKSVEPDRQGSDH